MWIIDNNPTMITTFASFWQTLPGIYYQRFLKFHLDWKNVHFFPNSSITIIISRERLVVISYILNNMPAKFLILIITSWNIFNFVFKFILLYGILSYSTCQFSSNIMCIFFWIIPQKWIMFYFSSQHPPNIYKHQCLLLFQKVRLWKCFANTVNLRLKAPSIEVPSLI